MAQTQVHSLRTVITEYKSTKEKRIGRTLVWLCQMMNYLALKRGGLGLGLGLGPSPLISQLKILS